MLIARIHMDYKVGLSVLPVSGFTIRMFANSTQVIERIFTERSSISLVKNGFRQNLVS